MGVARILGVFIPITQNWTVRSLTSLLQFYTINPFPAFSLYNLAKLKKILLKKCIHDRFTKKITFTVTQTFGKNLESSSPV